MLNPIKDMFKIRGIWQPNKIQLKIIFNSLVTLKGVNKVYASFLTKPRWQNSDQMLIVKNWQQQGNCQKVKEVVVASKNDQDLKEDLMKTKEKIIRQIIIMSFAVEPTLTDSYLYNISLMSQKNPLKCSPGVNMATCDSFMALMFLTKLVIQ